MRYWIVLAITAVGASLIGAAVTLYTYHHKYLDEKRNRDRDRKQHAYTQYAQFVGLYLDELMLMADVHPIISRIENGTADEAEVEEFQRVFTRVQSSLERLHDPTSSSLEEIVMLAPKHVRDAATDVFEVCLRVVGHMNRDEHDKVEAAESKFNKLIHEFRAAARADLGIRE